MISTKVHVLKCHTYNFKAVASGAMSFQIRLNDRNYKEGDCIFLKEIFTTSNLETGNTIAARITHMISEDGGLQDNYVLLNIEKLDILIREGVKYKTVLGN